MALTLVKKLILYSLGQFYSSINQPLVEKPLEVKTSKITFIELILRSGMVSKQERALYRNLEDLEAAKLIAYDQRMITLTDKGIKELAKIVKEIKQFNELDVYFQNLDKKKCRLQTVMH